MRAGSNERGTAVKVAMHMISQSQRFGEVLAEGQVHGQHTATHG